MEPVLHTQTHKKQLMQQWRPIYKFKTQQKIPIELRFLIALT